jgi:HD-GYP domain-containing protein (c-di-GMP phosphodiesterase class II)
VTNLLKFIKSYDEVRKVAESDASGDKPGIPADHGARGDAGRGAASPAARVATSSAKPEETADTQGLYHRSVKAVARLFDAGGAESITPGTLLAAVTDLEGLSPEIVRSTRASKNLLRIAMGTYAEGDSFILPHSVNVAILAVHLGRELELPESGLTELCLAGFVHDVGSVQLPAGLLTKADDLTPGEWDQMRSRPELGYEMLQALGQPYAAVAELSRQVYERLDGSGYPRGLKSDEILLGARILGTVDFFESFAHPRPYKALPPGGANHGIQMLMQMADKFGTATLKALVGSVGLFPIGSYVRLSGGEVGRVIDVSRENPMRPQVEILLSGDRRPPHAARVLDLLAIPHIFVSRALTASDLRELDLLPQPSEMPPLTGHGDSRS